MIRDVVESNALVGFCLRVRDGYPLVVACIIISLLSGLWGEAFLGLAAAPRDIPDQISFEDFV